MPNPKIGDWRLELLKPNNLENGLIVKKYQVLTLSHGNVQVFVGNWCNDPANLTDVCLSITILELVSPCDLHHSPSIRDLALKQST